MSVNRSNRKLLVAVLSLAFFGELVWGSALNATPIKKVLAACDNTPGCGYSINKKNGDISGCSKTSGKCFYCANDGKRQCVAVRRAVTQDRIPVVIAPDVKLK